MSTEDQIAYFLRVLDSGDTWQRAAAAKGLGKLGDAKHVAVLVRATADPAPEVREGAAVGLGRVGVAEAAVEERLLALMDDPDPQVRQKALVAAIRLGLSDQRFVDACVRLFRDPDRHLRILALDALRGLGVPGDADGLARLFGDLDPSVWGRARSMTFDFWDDPAVKAAVIRTAEEGEPAARAQALERLPPNFAKRLHPSLIAGLGDPSPVVRRAVLGWLSELPDDETTDMLVATLETEESSEVAGDLLHELGRREEQRAIAPALRWLRHPDAGRQAAKALGAIGTRTTLAHLRSALTDPELPGRTRGAAADAYGEAGKWDAVWLLLPLLEDPDDDVSAGAVEGIHALTDYGLRFWERGAVADALVARLAQGPKAIHRTHGALMGLTEALPALRELADGSVIPDVRRVALALLDPEVASDAHTPRDVPRFVRGLDDPDSGVRRSAMSGLGHWVTETGRLPPDEARVRERLTELASDDSRLTRELAAEALQALDGCRGR
ncbi:HEAT repeat domain-containing protein [Streptomyces sp. NPDC088387]|uniref:HEAT repeat domain-containing protein n=1 Tax=Streptomyces sp. NPDC088387 TaxID=3365859 RepID=UPI0038099A1C